jgi:PAS domain S-box-containing protein
MKAVTTEASEPPSPAEDAVRLILDTTPALIHTGRPDGFLDYFNRGWLQFLGRSLQEVRGWRWTDSVHPEDVVGLLRKWRASLTSGEPLEAEARVRRADGAYRLLLHRKVPLLDERGTIVKWYGSTVDIEDRKRAQESILQDKKEHRSESFLTEMADELRRNEFYLTEGQRLSHSGSWSFSPSGICDYWFTRTLRNSWV